MSGFSRDALQRRIYRDKSWLFDQYKKGLSVAQIAREATKADGRFYSVGTIYHWLNAFGIKRKGENDRRRNDNTANSFL